MSNPFVSNYSKALVLLGPCSASLSVEKRIRVVVVISDENLPTLYSNLKTSMMQGHSFSQRGSVSEHGGSVVASEKTNNEDVSLNTVPHSILFAKNEGHLGGRSLYRL